MKSTHVSERAEVRTPITTSNLTISIFLSVDLGFIDKICILLCTYNITYIIFLAKIIREMNTNSIT